MGKLIECCGKLAKTPYCFKGTGVYVYSIEEVCYYIGNNIYMVQNDFFDLEFIKWLRTEISMDELADQVEPLLNDRKNFKDIVAAICCSCDYFEEEEIKSIIYTIDQIIYLSNCERKTIEADVYLKKGQWEYARQMYKEIVDLDDFAKEMAEEKGHVLHNMAMADALCGDYEKAAVHFMRAYEKNQSQISKMQGLYAVLLSGNKEDWEQVMDKYPITEEEKRMAEENFLQQKKKCLDSKTYDQISNMSQLLEIGRKDECRNRMEECINKWKEEYRRQLSGEF